MDKPKNLFAELRERRLIQVLIAYAVIAWGAAQVAEFAVENYDLSRKFLDVTLLLLGLGLPAVLTITWYHGEKGYQRATRMEAVIITTLLVLAGIGTYRVSQAEPSFDLPSEQVVIDLGSESVAVLPFENRVADPELDWLGAGLAELITTGLAQIPTLQVVSGQRLFDLLRREGREDTERIPDALATRIAYRAGAHYMVDGSILGRADDMTINANLIDVASGRVVAASKARGPDVFVLVDSISSDLSAQILGAAVEPTEFASVADVTTENLEAYRAFQLGLQAQRRFHLEEAFEHYQRAVTLDSTFALAQLRLAGLAFDSGDLSTGLTALRAAEDNRERATGRDRLYLDGLLARIDNDDVAAKEAFTALVRLYPDDKEGRMALWQFYEGDSEERRVLMEEAIALDPLFANAHNELAYWHARNGNYETADSIIHIYAELEPEEPNPLDSRGEILEMAGEHARAREAYREALQLRPDFSVSLNHLARSWILFENRPAEAVAELEPYTRDSIAAVRIHALSLTRDALLAAGDIDAGIEASRRAAAEAAAVGDSRGEVQIIQTLLPTQMALGDFDAINGALGRLQLIDPLNAIGPFFGFAALGEQGQVAAMEALGGLIRGGVSQTPQMTKFLPIVTDFIAAEIAYYRGDFERSALMADSVRKQGGMMRLGNFSEIRSLLELDRAEEVLRQARQLEGDALRADGGRVDPVPLRQAYYYQARAYEQLGDTAQAVMLYGKMLDGWEDAAARMPGLSDAPDRLAALQAGS